MELNSILQKIEELERQDQMDVEEYKNLVEQAQTLREQQELKQQVQEIRTWASKPKGTPLHWEETTEIPQDSDSWLEIDGKKYFLPVGIQRKGYDSAFESYIRKGIDQVGPQDVKTLQSGLDPAGGFLVPTDWIATLIKKVAAQSVIRSRARVQTTSRDTATFPVLPYESDDIYTSGVRLTWSGELPASSTVHRVSGTESMFSSVRIDVHTAMASVPVGNDLLEDSAVDLPGLVSDLLSEAFALGEDHAFLTGNGVKRPRGLLTEVSEGVITSVNSGNASNVTADGLINLFFALPMQYRRNAVWVLSSLTQRDIEKLKDSSNRYLVSSLMSGSLASPETDMLRGKPILVDEFMPEVASNAYPILFGDLSGYTIMDRVGLSIQRLSEIYAESNMTVFLARKRVGGMTLQPWRFRAMKISA